MLRNSPTSFSNDASFHLLRLCFGSRSFILTLQIRFCCLFPVRQLQQVTIVLCLRECFGTLACYSKCFNNSDRVSLFFYSQWSAFFLLYPHRWSQRHKSWRHSRKDFCTVPQNAGGGGHGETGYSGEQAKQTILLVLTREKDSHSPYRDTHEFHSHSEDTLFLFEVELKDVLSG